MIDIQDERQDTETAREKYGFLNEQVELKAKLSTQRRLKFKLSNSMIRTIKRLRSGPFWNLGAMVSSGMCRKFGVSADEA
jgi:hypothetical protein